MDIFTTMCWSCQHEYDFELESCPKCGKANANVDITLAIWQMTEDPAAPDTPKEQA
jgi:rRNA maturation endonuclease Nob1